MISNDTVNEEEKEEKMFCPKCGKKLPDGSKICDSCGETLSNIMNDTSNTPTGEIPVSSKFIQPKNNATGKKFGYIIVGIMIIAAIVVGGIFFSLLLRDKNVYTYLADGKYELIKNFKKNKTVEIDFSDSTNLAPDSMIFSPDGKYIYYYTKYTTASATLCRAEYKKLKTNSDKNSQYIEVIATNVWPGLEFLDDGSFFYQSGDSRSLYYCKDTESTKIEDDVSSFFTDGSNRLLYVTRNYNSSFSLYGVSLEDINNKIRFSSKLSSVYDAHDFDNILFAEVGADYSENLYVAGFNKEHEKLGTNVKVLTTSDEKTYFIAENGNSVSLYDYVEDKYAFSDAQSKQPDIESFNTLDYEYEMISGSNLSENDFDELYTSCTQPLYWLGESTSNSYSMEEALNVKWGSDTDTIHKAIKEFMNKFADSADENGYILVTEEVKTALQKINQMDSNGKDWYWLWLCYNKKPYQNVDYDAYNASSDTWNTIADRIEIRKALQDKENNCAVYTLYSFEKGVCTEINNTVIDARAYSTSGQENDTVIFNTIDLINKKLNIDYITSIDDLNQVMKSLDIDYEEKNYILFPGDTTPSLISIEGYNDQSAVFYFTKDAVYVKDITNMNLYKAPIEENVAKDFELIASDVNTIEAIEKDKLYYTTQLYQNNDVSYCNLYSYMNGTSTCLAKDVVWRDIALYEDGEILAYTGYSYGAGYELIMIDSEGNTTSLGDDVTEYIRVDSSTLLYISDGKLASYDGKEKTIFGSDVEHIWSLNSMEVSHILGYDSALLEQRHSNTWYSEGE